jgi:hypothetical protein
VLHWMLMGNIMRTTICWFLGILRRGTAAGSKSEVRPEKHVRPRRPMPKATEDLLGFGHADGVASAGHAPQSDA